MMQFCLSEKPALAPFVKGLSACPMGNVSPKLKLMETEKNVFRLEISYELDREIQQDDCAAHLELGFAVSFFWMPHLTPTA